MSTDRQTLNISIIIPTLNETDTIGELLPALCNLSGVEVVVVDGGSSDTTVEVAGSYGVQVIRSQPGRAVQMNAGAEAAQGDILLFLHSDTELDVGFEHLIRQAVNQPGVAAGAFTIAIKGGGLGLRIIERLVNIRSNVLHMPYGDQGIFLTAKVFADIGGFPPLPIMEDFELMRRLRRRGRILVLPILSTTSARHWQRFGILHTTLRNQVLIIGYLLGVNPESLAAWYRGKKS
jgi:rSAM/selenodomain-associated transferase 2